MKKTLLVLSAAAALMISGCASHKAEAKEHHKAAEHAHGASHEKHWDYAENGPAHW